MDEEVLWVKAGLRGPVVKLSAGGTSASWIGSEPVGVPNTRYYRRRVEVGDLVLSKSVRPARDGPSTP